MPIHLVEYDPGWPEMFEAEAQRLCDAFGEKAVRIDHVGSSAVPGIAAKPVIDIQVSICEALPLDTYRSLLVALGYTYTEAPFPYFHKPARWPHTHHVHVRKAGGPEAQRTLAFRDWLRSHPDDRRAYENLKRALAGGADSASAEGRFEYSEAKTSFIREIERRSEESS